jgi:acyl-CoA reductase-like NAD-dependent aldehyde dehydrogenase
LRAIGQRFQDNVEALKQLLTAEQGKPHADAAMEIRATGMWMNILAQHDLPVEVLEDGPERRIEVRRVPMGVVGVIVPWNFPVMLGMGKVAPALLAGNTVIWKPSPFTPLTTLKIGEMLRDLLPPGVLNVISGSDELGPHMTQHVGIDRLSFVGSTATGRRVMESGASTLKRLTLELGGNDVAIVMPSVNVSNIVEKIFWGAFMNSGQVCLNTKRLYVHEDVYDSFADAITAYAQGVKVGNGAEEGTRLGPIQNRRQYERVRGLIDEAARDGAKFLCGGDTTPSGKGYFIQPTIIDDPRDDSAIVAKEQFGPVLPLLKFRDVEEVIARANDSEFGLGGSVWSGDVDEAYAIATRLQTGRVWVNTMRETSPELPLAGHKQSGIGVENGREGLLSYTSPQALVIRKQAA